MSFGIRAINPTTASNRPHIFGFQAPRSASGDTLLEVWNGNNSGAAVLVVDKDGGVSVTGAVDAKSLSIGGEEIIGADLTFKGVEVDAETIKSGTLDPDRLPPIDAEKISGSFGIAQGGTGRETVSSGVLLLGAGTDPLAELAPGAAGGFVRSDGASWVRAKIQATDLPEHTHDAADINAGTLSVDRIPGLDAAKIDSGTLNPDRLPDLDAGMVKSGTLGVDRGGTGLSTLGNPLQIIRVNEEGTALEFVDPAGGGGGGGADLETLSIGGTLVITSGRVLQNVSADAGIITGGTFNVARIPNLDASKITSGTLHLNRIPTIPASKVSAGTFGFGNFTVQGTLTSQGFFQSSSRRLKENIRRWTGSALSVLRGVDVVEYNYLTDPVQGRVGIIAEDTDPILSGVEQKHFLHDNAIGLLIRAVQELASQCEAMESRLAEVG